MVEELDLHAFAGVLLNIDPKERPDIVQQTHGAYKAICVEITSDVVTNAAGQS